MTDLFATVAGHRAKALRLYVPNRGPWFLDAELDEAVSLTGQADIAFGSLRMHGTVAPAWSGSFALTARVRVVAGGAGWGKPLAPKTYHNDGGVRGRTVAEDAAREAGESLGTFNPGGPVVLGNDYVRRAGPASRALEDAAQGSPWWVDYQGRTHVGARPSVATEPGKATILGYEPRGCVATLAVDDPSDLGIGSVLTDARLEAPRTARELEFNMRPDSLRVLAWCGGDDATESRLVRTLTAIVERILARRLYGKYRYRVVSMAVDGRVNLQAISKAAGLPDVVPAMIRPGVSGWSAELALGSEVLVEFIAGKPTDPIVTAFPGKGEPGHAPTIERFGYGVAPVARVGDTVAVFFPPVVPVTGSLSGAPFAGTLTIAGTTLGIIQTGRVELLA